MKSNMIVMYKIFFFLLWSCILISVRAQPPEVRIKLVDSFYANHFFADSTVVTTHQVTIKKKVISYKAITGTLPIRDEKGRIIAGVFSVYYQKTGVSNQSRPIIFFFNGGYGSPAKWLHMGYAGPRIANTDEKGLPVMPYGVVENPYTLLDIADLVFVDPVGTGYSHPISPLILGDNRFYNEKADVNYLRKFISSFLDRHNRRVSPVFLLGESNGGRRVAGLSGLFSAISTESYINLAGIILVSSAKLFSYLGHNNSDGIPVPFKIASWLPYYCRYAFQQGLLSKADELKDSASWVADSERFAVWELLPMLLKYGILDETSKQDLAAKVSRFTGIPPEIILSKELLIDTSFFKQQSQKLKPAPDFSSALSTAHFYYKCWNASSSFVTEAFTHRYYRNGQNDPDSASMRKMADTLEGFLVHKYLPALIMSREKNSRDFDINIESVITRFLGGIPEKPLEFKSFEHFVDSSLSKIGWNEINVYDTRYNKGLGFYAIPTPTRNAIDPALLDYTRNSLKYYTELPYDDDPSVVWGPSNNDPIRSLKQAMGKSPFTRVLIQAGYYDRATNYMNQKLNMWQIDPSGKLKDRVSFKSYRAGHMMYYRKSERLKACDDLRAFVLSCIGINNR